MKFHRTTLYILLAVLLLPGCSSIEPIPYDRMKHGEISKILLVWGGDPDQMLVDMNLHPGSGIGGALGAIVEGIDLKHKMEKYNDAIEANSVEMSLSKTINRTIIDKLQNEHYQVHAMDTPVGRHHEFLENYEGYSADAFLDIRILYAGYRSKTSLAPYLPVIAVKVRMVDGNTGEDLYLAYYYYGVSSYLPEGVNKIEPSEAYTFSDINDLVTQSARSELGLKNAAITIADHIAIDIR